MPRKTYTDRLFEMGAISATVHSILKTEEERRKAAKAKDAARITEATIAKAMRITEATIAKAMRPNAKVTGAAPTNGERSNDL